MVSGADCSEVFARRARADRLFIDVGGRCRFEMLGHELVRRCLGIEVRCEAGDESEKADTLDRLGKLRIVPLERAVTRRQVHME